MIDLSTTHVIAVVSNPMRYKSRWELYRTFEQDVVRKGANLWTLEVQTGARLHQITTKSNPKNFQISSSNLTGIVWIKENMMNLALQQLSIHQPNWRYVIFTDADVKYESHWIEETAHALQLHPVVQPWSHAVDLGPDGAATSDKMQLSYAYCHVNRIEVKTTNQYTKGGHPGYSIAFRRDAINQLGGLIETAALGSGDRHMMTALVGKVNESFHPNVSQGYKNTLYRWQKRADIYIKRNLGYVPCVVRHGFHGAKSNRQYGSRWGLLVKWQFNPDTDLKRDSSGVLTLVTENDRQIGFRDDTYRYYKTRNEDARTL
jgi:hypothetical protein